MNAKGFTLVEMLLSVGIITLLVGVSLPVYAGFVSSNDLDLTTQNIASALRRAQEYARGVSGDSQWGVAVQPNQAVLFKGATYATRTAGFDEPTTISSTVTPSGLTEIDFSKLSAAPSTTGSITLTSSTTGGVRVITINAKGTIGY
jgi:prepilin-type N-terminal cleavage/methylation domain-containing protein